MSKPVHEPRPESPIRRPLPFKWRRSGLQWLRWWGLLALLPCLGGCAVVAAQFYERQLTADGYRVYQEQVVDDAREAFIVEIHDSLMMKMGTGPGAQEALTRFVERVLNERGACAGGWQFAGTGGAQPTPFSEIWHVQCARSSL